MTGLVRELLYDRGPTSIARLNGIPRSGADGRHRRLVAYIGPDVTTAELVRLLRDAAESLAKTLPRLPE